jgi:hypothetical protein
MRGVKRSLYYLGAGIAPYAITVFVDWGNAWNIATWTAGQRFGLLIFMGIFLIVALVAMTVIDD